MIKNSDGYIMTPSNKAKTCLAKAIEDACQHVQIVGVTGKKDTLAVEKQLAKYYQRVMRLLANSAI